MTYWIPKSLRQFYMPVQKKYANILKAPRRRSTMKIFSDDVWMLYGLDKSWKDLFIKGLLVSLKKEIALRILTQ